MSAALQKGARERRTARFEMPDTGSDSAKEVFGLLALELWHQQFVRLPASDAAVNAKERAEVPLFS